MSLRTIIKTKPALLLVTSRSCQHGIGRVPLLSLQHRRGAAMFENTPVITPGMPGYNTHVQNKTVITIEEAVYQMPENAGKVSRIYLLTQRKLHTHTYSRSRHSTTPSFPSPSFPAVGPITPPTSNKPPPSSLSSLPATSPPSRKRVCASPRLPCRYS